MEGSEYGLLQNVGGQKGRCLGKMLPCLIRMQRPPGPQITPTHAQLGGRMFRKARLWRTCTVLKLQRVGTGSFHLKKLCFSQEQQMRQHNAERSNVCLSTLTGDWSSSKSHDLFNDVSLCIPLSRLLATTCHCHRQHDAATTFPANAQKNAPKVHDSWGVSKLVLTITLLVQTRRCH